MLQTAKPLKIALIGGSGFIGTSLIRKMESTATIYLFSRKSSPVIHENIQIIPYRTTNELTDQLSSLALDGIINLAGHPVAGHRWTSSQKKKIYDSRVMTTQAAVNSIRQTNNRPSFLVNASAVGYYGDTGDRETDETASPGNGFLSKVCQDWEAEAMKAVEYKVRVVLPRFGLILGAGGALPKILFPYRYFMGGPLGSGRQWISWIHIEDAVQIILEAVAQHHYSGPINVVSPQPVMMREFADTLARTLKRPSFFRVPEWLLRFALGEEANIIIHSQRVIPQKLFHLGYSFRFVSLEKALNHLIAKNIL